MFDRLKRLYDSGRMTKAMLKNAVEKNLLTADEYAQIAGEEYDG